MTNLDFGFYNEDCLPRMKEYPDNFFDLAIVDPPYGAGFTESGECKGWFSKYHQNAESRENVEREREYTASRQYNRFGNPGSRFERYKPCDEDGGNVGGEVHKKIIAWDVAPKQEYFEELFRISRNQIIWGGNCFDLPPTRCFVIWEKLSISENFSMAMAEYAWTSFNDNAKIFKCAPQGKAGDTRFHPTQKPVALYEWLLNRYAKPGDKILDTHVGSASSLIACHNTNHKYVGFEIDETYYKLAKERIERETAQMNIFNFME